MSSIGCTPARQPGPGGRFPRPQPRNAAPVGAVGPGLAVLRATLGLVAGGPRPALWLLALLTACSSAPESPQAIEGCARGRLSWPWRPRAR
jgi:hypothetical protein